MFVIISNNEKSILKCKHTHKMKLRDIIPGYEVNPIKFSHEPNHVIFNFSLHVLTEDKKVYFVKDLGFVYHIKRLSMLAFLHNLNCFIGIISENRHFLKNKLKYICFSTGGYYRLH